MLTVFIIVLLLGFDTLFVSVSLGVLKAKGTIKIAIVFACAEGIVPLIGLFIGQTEGKFIGEWTSIIGGLTLVAVSIWLIFFLEHGAEEGRNFVRSILMASVISISLNELSVGIYIGLIGVPVFLTFILIVFQAFVFTIIGLTFGRSFKPYLGEYSKKIAGVILGLLGLLILVETLLKSY